MAVVKDTIHFVFDHVHFYCHSLRSLEEYQELEKLFTAFDNKRGKKCSVEEGKKIFEELGGKRFFFSFFFSFFLFFFLSFFLSFPPLILFNSPPHDRKEHSLVAQDVVEQLITGFGFRIR